MPWKMNENILYAPLKIQRYIKSNFYIYFLWVNMLRHRFAAALGNNFADGSAKIYRQYSRMRNGCVNTRKYI